MRTALGIDLGSRFNQTTFETESLKYGKDGRGGGALYWYDANLKDRTYLKRYTVMSVEGKNSAATTR
jgi:hypothetical protein